MTSDAVRHGRGVTTVLALPLALAASLALAAGVWALGAPPLWAWLAGAGIATTLAYAWDKAQAGRAGAARIRERDLLILTATGVLGAWVGQSLVRHKTRVTRFQLVLALATFGWGLVVVLSLR